MAAKARIEIPVKDNTILVHDLYRMVLAETPEDSKDELYDRYNELFMKTQFSVDYVRLFQKHVILTVNKVPITDKTVLPEYVAR